MTAVVSRVAGAGGLLSALRVRQWTKNLLVLTPLLPAADAVGPDALVGALITVAMFCLLSSAVYLVNDVIDVEEDRAHPVKRDRAIAAGTVTRGTALTVAAVLAVAGLGLASLRGTSLVLVALTYLVSQAAYCLWLKREPVIELGLVASGFLLRALAGGVGAGIVLSPWFLLAAGFGSLFVAAGKRFAEADRGARDGVAVRRVVRAYRPSYLRFVWTTSAALVIATYALWAVQVQVQTGSAWSTVSTVPFVLALLRYAVDVDAGAGEEPEEVILRDRMLLGLGVLWACLLVAAAVQT